MTSVDAIEQQSARIAELEAALQARDAQIEELREAFESACAFIDSHVADPDITAEMVRTYTEFQKHRAALASTAPDKETKNGL